MWEQVEDDNSSLAEVTFKQVLLTKLHEIAHPCSLSVLVGLPDALRIDVDTDAPSAELLGSCDRDSSVSAPQVVENVVISHPR